MYGKATFQLKAGIEIPSFVEDFGADFTMSDKIEILAKEHLMKCKTLS